MKTEQVTVTKHDAIDLAMRRFFVVSGAGQNAILSAMNMVTLGLFTYPLSGAWQVTPHLRLSKRSSMRREMKHCVSVI